MKNDYKTMNNIVFVSATQGYPKRYTAGNSKVEFLSKGLIEQGSKTSIINEIYGEKNLKEFETGIKNGSNFFLFSRKKYMFITIIYNFIKFYRILNTVRDKKLKNFIIYDFDIYPVFLLQIFIARILGYYVVIISHEYHIDFKHKGLFRLSNYVFDKTFGYFANAILPISSFLVLKAKIFKKPILQIPALADFQSHIEDEQIKSCNYFLFCGHARFLRLIIVILDGFKEFCKVNETINLKLVLSGNLNDIDIVQSVIENHTLSNKVFITHSLPYNDLFELYRNALSLLIPLSENRLTDKARFSQKIAEYLSSKRPIITVKVGVIPDYFMNNFNAFICDKLNPEELLKIFLFVASNTDKANEVGLNGFYLGLEIFDYRSNGIRLNNFLSSLN